MHDAGCDQKHIADYKGRGKEMHELESLRVFLSKDDTRLARVLHLTEKRAELDSSLMIYESLGKRRQL